MNASGYILFHTSSAAFRAERLATRSGLAAPRLVPTPRELSSDCGVCLRFEAPASSPGEAPGGPPADPSGEAAARAARVARDWLERERIPYDQVVAPG